MNFKCSAVQDDDDDDGGDELRTNPPPLRGGQKYEMQRLGGWHQNQNYEHNDNAVLIMQQLRSKIDHTKYRARSPFTTHGHGHSHSHDGDGDGAVFKSSRSKQARTSGVHDTQNQTNGHDPRSKSI